MTINRKSASHLAWWQGRRFKNWRDENEIRRRYDGNSAEPTIPAWLMSKIVRREIEKLAHILPKSVDNNLAGSSTKARRATACPKTYLTLIS